MESTGELDQRVLAALTRSRDEGAEWRYIGSLAAELGVTYGRVRDSLQRLSARGLLEDRIETDAELMKRLTGDNPPPPGVSPKSGASRSLPILASRALRDFKTHRRAHYYRLARPDDATEAVTTLSGP